MLGCRLSGKYIRFLIKTCYKKIVSYEIINKQA